MGRSTGTGSTPAVTRVGRSLNERHGNCQSLVLIGASQSERSAPFSTFKAVRTQENRLTQQQGTRPAHPHAFVKKMVH